MIHAIFSNDSPAVAIIVFMALFTLVTAFVIWVMAPKPPDDDNPNPPSGVQ